MPRFSECWRCGNTVGVGVICNLCEVAKYCNEKCQRNDIFRHEAECIPASILKTCTSCRKSGPNLKACTGCYQAFYCDAKCQKSNWERHKIDCLETKEKIELLARRILTYYFPISFTLQSTKLPSCDYYYWGNVPAFDCLNLVENEGENYSMPLKVLFLGVGDLRNVALTCASLPDSYENKITFTLNDKASCVLARLVLFLYMLVRGVSEVEKTITELWYSISLSESTYKYLTKTLEELINIRSLDDLRSKTLGLINIQEDHLKKLQDVWKKWLHLRVQGTNWIQKQRIEVLRKSELKGGLNALFTVSVPKQHASTAKKWIEDGAFRRTRLETPPFAENPTLTGYDQTSGHAPYSYCIHSECSPFFGWDYLQAKKFKNSSCLVTMFGDYIEHILHRFKNKLTKQQISFQVVMCNCMDIKQHLDTNALYDRISTSNLIDYIILPILLKLCSEILNRSNTCATIITGTITWADEFCPPDKSQVSKLKKFFEADVKRYPNFQNDHPMPCIREYADDSCDFYNYLRALFYAYLLRKRTVTEHNTSKQIKIPIMKELGKEFQLRLRDFLRNENKIVFFKLAVNRRTVNFVVGDECFLEWTPLQE